MSRRGGRTEEMLLIDGRNRPGGGQCGGNPRRGLNVLASAEAGHQVERLKHHADGRTPVGRHRRAPQLGDLDRLQAVETRREIIERNLRVHYPTLGKGDSLFSDFETFDFSQLDHHGYSCVTRGAAGLRQRLISCTKFEKLAQYCCANLFYLVIGESLHETVFELPLGWGLLVEKNATLELAQKPVWHEMSAENKVRFLRRLAAAATRAINRELKITPEIVEEARRDLGFSK